MSLTSKQIQGDVIRLLEDSPLTNVANGEIYRSEKDRPRDSKMEDIIVIFTTGNAEQIQEGTITLNVYVPDVDRANDGVLVENSRRCEELEVAANEWVKSLTAERSNYKFALQQVVYTEAEPKINQHFVVVKLKFKILTF